MKGTAANLICAVYILLIGIATPLDMIFRTLFSLLTFSATQARKIPLEIAVTSDEFPMYSVTTEDDGRGYAATKLPFQVRKACRYDVQQWVAFMETSDNHGDDMVTV